MTIKCNSTEMLINFVKQASASCVFEPDPSSNKNRFSLWAGHEYFQHWNSKFSRQQS